MAILLGSRDATRALRSAQVIVSGRTLADRSGDRYALVARRNCLLSNRILQLIQLARIAFTQRLNSPACAVICAGPVE